MLHVFPVVIPYRLDGDDAGFHHSITVQAMATQPQAAQAVAQVLVRALAQIRHRGRVCRMLADEVRIGPPGEAVDGPYAYLFTTVDRIDQINFPARIDQDRGVMVEQQLEGIASGSVHGVLIDALHLVYLNSLGLAAFAAHGHRLNLRMSRANPGIAKVVQVTGLARVMPLYPDLQSALGDLVKYALPG